MKHRRHGTREGRHFSGQVQLQSVLHRKVLHSLDFPQIFVGAAPVAAWWLMIEWQRSVQAFIW